MVATVGTPVVLIVNAAGAPTVNVAALALVMTGAWFVCGGDD